MTTFESRFWGGYSEMVITRVCGSRSTGSIPVSHPKGDFHLKKSFDGSFFDIWEVLCLMLLFGCLVQPSHEFHLDTRVLQKNRRNSS